MLTDDDKALVERLQMHRSWRTGDGDLSDAPHKAADRIEVLSGLFTNATYEAAEMMKEIERLREALGWYAEDNHWRYIPAAGCSCVDADGGDVARAALEETLHVPETCKENGETFT